jgi:hypothetical protein
MKNTHWIFIFSSIDNEETSEYFLTIDNLLKLNNKNIQLSIILIDHKKNCYHFKNENSLEYTKNWKLCLKKEYNKYKGFNKKLLYCGHSDEFVLGNSDKYWISHFEFSKEINKYYFDLIIADACFLGSISTLSLYNNCKYIISTPYYQPGYHLFFETKYFWNENKSLIIWFEKWCSEWLKKHDNSITNSIVLYSMEHLHRFQKLLKKYYSLLKFDSSSKINYYRNTFGYDVKKVLLTTFKKNRKSLHYKKLLKKYKKMILSSLQKLGKNYLYHIPELTIYENIPNYPKIKHIKIQPWFKDFNL